MIIRAAQLNFLRRDFLVRRLLEEMASDEPNLIQSDRQLLLQNAYDIGMNLGITEDRPLGTFMALCLVSSSPQNTISLVRKHLQEVGGDADSAIEGILNYIFEKLNQTSVSIPGAS